MTEEKKSFPSRNFILVTLGLLCILAILTAFITPTVIRVLSVIVTGIGFFLLLKGHPAGKILSLLGIAPKALYGAILLFGGIFGIDTDSFMPDMPSSTSTFDWMAYEQAASIIYFEMFAAVISVIVFYFLIKYKPEK